MHYVGCWLETNNQDEVLSRRPTRQRVIFGLLAGLLLLLAFRIMPHSLTLFANRATWVAGIFIPFYFVSMISCFLLGTGPLELRLDVQRQRYSLTQGVWFLTWTKYGETRGGKIYVTHTKSRHSQVRFKARHWKYGLPVEFCKTEAEAGSLAWEIAGKLGLDVKTGRQQIRRS